MSSKNLRLIFRYAHLALIAAFVYSKSLQASTVHAGLIQFVVLPLVTLTSIAMWQPPRYNKWRNGRKQVNHSRSTAK